MKKNEKNSKSERPEKHPDLRDPAYYINRELSWMQFDERILEEARDTSLPLFERLSPRGKRGAAYHASARAWRRTARNSRGAHARRAELLRGSQTA